MEVSYATMIAMGTLVQRLGRDAQRYQAALAEAVNESAEWKRIADELKAERDALRSTTIDTAAGHLLDAFGSLANEPRNGATDDAYRDRIVTKIHTIKLERDALRAQLDTERERHKQTASILAQYAPKTMQIEPPPEATHDMPEGKQAAESVIQDCRKTDLLSWHCPRCKRTVSSRESMTFCPSCAGNLEGVPCVPATAVKTAPKPGDTVRLVRVPTTEDCPEYDSSDVAQMQAVRARIHTTGVVIGVADCGRCVRTALSSDNHIINAWPLSCIEIVEDAK